MNPHLLYLALSLAYAEAAFRSFRERNWHGVIHNAIAAMAYVCLALASVLPVVMVISDNPVA